MPTFKYRVKHDDTVSSGTVSAANKVEALAQVRKNRGMVLELKQEGGGISIDKFLQKQRLSLKERIIFTEQIGVMLHAGITLPQALQGLMEEAPRSFVRELYESMSADLTNGLPFSQILLKHPKSFSAVFANMVASSEKSGNLSDIMLKLTEQQQKEYDLRGKVRGALLYPAVISVLLVGVITLVITFVLPRLSSIFLDSAVTLPMSTKILLAISDFMVHSWYLLIIGIIGLIVAIKMVGRTNRGRYLLDSFKLRVPVLGRFQRKAIIVRFAQTFSFLNQAGVPVLDIFKTLRGVVGNAVYARELEKIEKEVSNGVALSVALRKSKHFPVMVGQLVRVGEQSGDLAGMFEVLGGFYEKEVDAMAKNLSVLLEPIIMIIMGVVIGFVVISVIQPIYGLINAV